MNVFIWTKWNGRITPQKICGAFMEWPNKTRDASIIAKHPISDEEFETLSLEELAKRYPLVKP